MKLQELSINEFINELSSRAATPGGGSVAGLAAAKSAGLLKMVIGLSKNASLQQYIPALNQIGEEAIILVNEDSLAFERVMQGYRLTKNTEEERKKRRAEIQLALKEATITPLKTMRLGLKLLKIVPDLVEQGNPNTISDLGVAGLMASAALKGAFYNVLINLQSVKDQGMVDATAKEANQLFRQAAEMASRVEKQIISRLTGSEAET